MTELSDDGSWLPIPASGGEDGAARPDGRLAAALLTSRPLVLRLNVAGLQAGRLVSTQQGGASCLWMVESVTDGAGDGCVEVTLRAQA